MRNSCTADNLRSPSVLGNLNFSNGNANGAGGYSSINGAINTSTGISGTGGNYGTNTISRHAPMANGHGDLDDDVATEYAESDVMLGGVSGSGSGSNGSNSAAGGSASAGSAVALTGGNGGGGGGVNVGGRY